MARIEGVSEREVGLDRLSALTLRRASWFAQ
jgi:hypothetical protein